MSAELIAAIAVQEERLVFERFDADLALEIGLDIRERVAAAGKAVVIDVRFWDRRLFWFAMPGTTMDNEDWVRRKVNAVRRFQKSTFRLGLEKGGQLLPAEAGPEAVAECVLAGGGFPLKVQGRGVRGGGDGFGAAAAGGPRGGGGGAGGGVGGAGGGGGAAGVKASDGKG